VLPSWRLKVLRAQGHLTELEGLLAADTQRRPHPVSETLEPDNQLGEGPWWYRVALDFTPDEMVPVVAGDFLFDLRSAIDHIAVALAPEDRKHKAAFPIFTSDPLATDPAGNDLKPKAARAWRRMTQGMALDVVAALTWLQPHASALRHSGKPADHYLAILQALQNADKHRELVVLTTGVAKSEVRIEGVTNWIVPVLPDGAPLFDSPHKVNVELEGTLSIAFGIRSKGPREFPRIFHTILDAIAFEVLPTLEPLAPPSPDWTPLALS
jgi:hypothetical protein